MVKFLKTDDIAIQIFILFVCFCGLHTSIANNQNTI